ncbi:hypothetical protein, partial [Catellatospora sichuanensis]|uniref:hypothetical protein n=1 Tax=Catellatospora sichuanensis TaxID=1969805 RepID=UPI001C92188A
SEHHHDTMNTKPCPPPADRASPCRYKLTSNDAYMLTANAAQHPCATRVPNEVSRADVSVVLI